MTTRQLIADNGTTARYKVFDEQGHPIGYDEEPSVGTPGANQGVIVQRTLAAVAGLENAFANWSTLSAVQKDAASKAAVAVAARLARLVLNQFDSSGA